MTVTIKRILLVHNFYRTSAPSGENVAFESERDMLLRRGHDVHVFARRNDDIGESRASIAKVAIGFTWNPSSYQEMLRQIETHRPEIVHVHNVFPQLSPAIFHACSRQGIPVVLTVHNFRMLCAAGVPMREGKTCFECVDRRSVFPAVRHGCYRGSRIATIPIASSIAFHRVAKTWQLIDGFIALSEFQRGKLVDGGIPADRIVIKPHFLAQTGKPKELLDREQSFIYVGRLTEEKGVVHLLRAWARVAPAGYRLIIVGGGADLPFLKQEAHRLGISASVQFEGMVSQDRVRQLLEKARALILPSLCVEGFPMVVREAYGYGVPVVASDIGSLTEWVPERAGLLVKPGHERELASAIDRLAKDDVLAARLSLGAWRLFCERLTEDVNYTQLMQIYEDVRKGRAIGSK